MVSAAIAVFVEAAVTLLHAQVRGAIDLGRAAPHWCKAEGEECALYGGREEREVGEYAEAAEGLAEQRELLAAAQAVPHRLAVTHDAVGSEVRQVRGLLLRRGEAAETLCGHGRGAAGAALVEQEDAVPG